MRSITILLFISIIFVASQVLSGEGHDHSHDHDHSHGVVSETEAVKRATQKIAQLAKAEKIDSSWEGVDYSSIEQKTFGDRTEWVVTFNNDQISDDTKQTLFLFYTLSGHYIAANYTGE